MAPDVVVHTDLLAEEASGGEGDADKAKPDAVGGVLGVLLLLLVVVGEEALAEQWLFSSSISPRIGLRLPGFSSLPGTAEIAGKIIARMTRAGQDQYSGRAKIRHLLARWLPLCDLFVS